jgi:hypothetical protein
MSIKIYNAFRLNSDDPEVVEAFVSQVQEQARLRRLDSLSKLISGMLTKRIDSHAAGRSTEKPGPDALNVLIEDFLKAEKVQSESKYRYHDGEIHAEIACSMSLMAHPSHPGCLFGIPYELPNGWTSMIMDHPLVEEFGYWDNTDMPDEMTEEAWAQRADIWMDIAVRQTPAQSGTEYTIVNCGPAPDVEAIIACTPTLEQRIKDAAENVFKDNYFTRMKEVFDAEKPGQEIRASQIISWLYDAEELIALDDPEYLAAKAEAEEGLSSSLDLRNYYDAIDTADRMQI